MEEPERPRVKTDTSDPVSGTNMGAKKRVETPAGRPHKRQKLLALPPPQVAEAAGHLEEDDFFLGSDEDPADTSIDATAPAAVGTQKAELSPLLYFDGEISFGALAR